MGRRLDDEICEEVEWLISRGLRKVKDFAEVRGVSYSAMQKFFSKHPELKERIEVRERVLGPELEGFLKERRIGGYCISEVARELNIDPSALQDYLDRHPELKSGWIDGRHKNKGVQRDNETLQRVYELRSSGKIPEQIARIIGRKVSSVKYYLSIIRETNYGGDFTK